DLRLLVRERLKAGDSDTQVLDFLTARYGQFVLLKPRFGWDTALLWGAPAGVLLVGALAIVMSLRRRQDPSAPTAPLTDDETRRLNTLARHHGQPPPHRFRACLAQKDYGPAFVTLALLSRRRPPLLRAKSRKYKHIQAVTAAHDLTKD